MDNVIPFLPLIGALIAVGCLFAAFRDGRQRRLIENLPTCKTTGIFIGLVELKGTAESDAPLESYLAQTLCVQYVWTVEEHWSRTVVETETDSKGNTHTVTRHESGWTTVGSGGEMSLFYLKDDCGLVQVRPEGAKVEPVKMFDTTCGRGSPLYYGKGPAGAVANSDYERRFVEHGIPLQTMLFLVGQARERQDVVAPEIAADTQAPMYLISARSQEQVDSGMKWGSYAWAGFGLLAAVGCMVGRDAGMQVDFNRHILIYVAIGLGYLLLGGLCWVWMVFNSLVDLRQRVRQAWSLIDIQLKRRFDLIPNLVNCVTGYRDHEAQLQTELAALRSQLAATPPGQPGADHAAISNVVIGIAERYPELKANEAFLSLQKTLSDTENRIALARGYFNDIATHYNTRLETVPERYVATLGAMKQQPLMEANDFERASVKVNLVQPTADAPKPN